MVWLDNARILAIFAVILLHVAVGAAWSSEPGSFLWIYNTSFDVLVRWCVPVFVMISGALLLEPHGQETLGDFYKKRFSKILLPFFFWSLVYIFWGHFRENIQEPLSFAYIVERLASGKPYYHLWFLYMLIGLYAFTPVFRLIVTQLKTRDLVFFLALAYGIATIEALYEVLGTGETNLFPVWFLMFVPYYLTGYLARHYEPSFSTGTLALITLFFAALAPALMCLTRLYVEGPIGIYFLKNLSITNIALSISLLFLLKRMNKPMFGTKMTKEVSGVTFGIYLVHMIPLAYLGDLKDLWALFPSYLYVPLFSLAIMIATAIICLAMTRMPFLRRTI